MYVYTYALGGLKSSLLAKGLPRPNRVPIPKGSKNVFVKNKKKCRDGTKCLRRTRVPAWKHQLAEKLQEQGGASKTL